MAEAPGQVFSAVSPSEVDNAPTLGASWRYVACGVAVLPVAYREKRPHGGYRWGQVTEPQSMEEIERLLPMEPSLNVGIVCGPPSGNLLVLDLDGALTLENVLTACPVLAETWMTRTGRTQPGPGYHIFVRASGRTPTITGGAFHRDLGLDVKATGSYVVVPPSIHPSGRQYVFERGVPEKIVHVGDARRFLLELLRRLGVSP